jgi:hypothetical protein
LGSIDGRAMIIFIALAIRARQTVGNEAFETLWMRPYRWT